MGLLKRFVCLVGAMGILSLLIALHSFNTYWENIHEQIVLEKQLYMPFLKSKGCARSPPVTSNPPRVAVVTYYTPEIEVFGKLMEENHAKYAKIHNYTQITANHLLRYEGKEAGCEKQRVVDELLYQFDILVWADADAFFYNFRSIESVIRKDSKFDMYITRGAHGTNSGVFIIRNTEWSHQFLKEVNTNLESFLWCVHKKGPEGSAVRQVFNDHPEYACHVKIYGRHSFRLMTMYRHSIRNHTNALDFPHYTLHNMGRECKKLRDNCTQEFLQLCERTLLDDWPKVLNDRLMGQNQGARDLVMQDLEEVANKDTAYDGKGSSIHGKR